MPDHNLKILIVEDDLSSQQYYSVIFEAHYEILIVPTVEEAKQVLREQAFGVAIIDISLPGDEDGIDLIKYLRQKYPQKPVPIVLTAHVFEQNRADTLAAGAAEFFTKPMMSGDLLDAVGKYMKRVNSTNDT